MWKQLLGNAEPWPFLGRDNPSFYLIGEVIPPGGRTYGHLCPQGNRKAQVHLSRESLFEWSFWFRFLILVKTQFTGFSSSVRRPERLGRRSRGSPREPAGASGPGRDNTILCGKENQLPCGDCTADQKATVYNSYQHTQSILRVHVDLGSREV